MTNGREHRQRLKREYEGLFADLSAYLFEADPMGLNYEINPDEYDPEVGTILPRVLEMDTEEEIADVVREEFDRWFSGPVIQRSTYEDARCRHLSDSETIQNETSSLRMNFDA